MKGDYHAIERAVLAALLVILIALDIALYVYFKDRLVVYGLSRVVITKNLDSFYRAPITRAAQNPSLERGSQAEKDSLVLAAETKDVVAGAISELDKARQLRKWVNAQVVRFGSDVELITGNSMKPVEMLADIRRGYSVQCGPLSILLIEALRANGIAARQIGMAESIPFRQGLQHALVEAYVDGRWVAMDPTFNVEFAVNGVPAAAFEARHAYLSAGALLVGTDDQPDLRLRHLYPAYNRAIQNLFIVEELPRVRKNLARLPFFKLMLPSIYVPLDTTESKSTSPFRLLNWLTWLVYFHIPLAGGSIFIILLYSIRRY